MNYIFPSQDAEIEKSFEQVFDYFRSTSLQREEYFVALYLLYVYYKKIKIEITLIDYIVQFNKTDIYSHSRSLNKDQVFQLNEFFRPALEVLDTSGQEAIYAIFKRIDHKIFDSNFSEIFDRLLNRLSKSQGRFSGEFMMPEELSRFMYGLAKLPSNAKVYNPFAGAASFAVYLNGEQAYLGQEISRTAWAIGAMRILVNEREVVSSFVLGDSLNDWNPTSVSKDTDQLDLLNSPNEKEEFDLIISIPPFGLRLNHQINGHFGPYRFAELFLIENGLVALKQKGKMILCVPQGFLFGQSAAEQNLRMHLIDNDILEMVISLPSGMFMNTGVATAIIVINKDKKEKGKVRFVEAKSFVELSPSKEKKLNDYKLNTAIRNSIDTEVLRIVPNETIAANDFNLNVPRYFQKEIYGAKLCDIGSIIRGSRMAAGQKGKIVRIRDLNDDKIDFQLSVENMEDVALPRQVQCLEESCIIMALRGNKLKPTFFNYSGTPIFLTSDTLAFKVDETKVDPIFLINELNAEYAVEQLNAYRIGATIPTVRRDDLLDIKIHLLSLEEQRAKVAGIIEISAKINQLQAERNALAHGFGQKQFNEFASLKHTLGTPRQNILSYAEALISFFKKNSTAESEKVRDDFKVKMGVDLNSAFYAIKQDINFISELLEKGENGLQLSDYNLETINLQDLEKFVSKVKSTSSDYSLIIQPLKIYNKAEQGITSNNTLLKILLDNILLNAQKHGFDSKKESNEVVLDLSVLDEDLILDIKNNGKKFPKGFDKEKFIAKYSTANPNNGTGIGGYDINRIIEYFGGTWDLILNEDIIYPVRFRIKFPIKSI